jgi:hypothetical protein
MALAVGATNITSPRIYSWEKGVERYSSKTRNVITGEQPNSLRGKNGYRL